MTPRAAAWTFLIAGVLTPGSNAVAQEGTWSVSTAAGVSFLEFDDVDEDGRRDIAVYNDPVNGRGIPIGNYPALRYAPVVQAAVHYRYERDMGATLHGQFQQARTSTSFRDSLHGLSLDRRLSSIVLGTDIMYFFPPLVGNSEVSIFAGLAYLWATADQITRETLTVKAGPLTEQRIAQDAYANYKKSQIIVRAGARILVPFGASVSLTGGATYHYARLGSMSGTLREFDVIRPHDTAVKFNYSALQLTLGVEYAF